LQRPNLLSEIIAWAVEGEATRVAESTITKAAGNSEVARMLYNDISCLPRELNFAQALQSEATDTDALLTSASPAVVIGRYDPDVDGKKSKRLAAIVGTDNETVQDAFLAHALRFYLDENRILSSPTTNDLTKVKKAGLRSEEEGSQTDPSYAVAPYYAGNFTPFMLRTLQQYSARMNLTLAGLEALNYPPDDARRFKVDPKWIDPASGKPFTYSRTKDGFQILSADQDMKTMRTFSYPNRNLS
jgi:hypothetical protein